MKSNHIYLLYSHILLIILSQAKAYSYPQVEMQACLSSAINAVAQKETSATYKQVLQYCDCSLRKILDEGGDINAAVSYCNKKYIYR